MAGYTLEPTDQVEIDTDLTPLAHQRSAHMVIPAPVCRIENVLGEQGADALLSFCIDHQDQFRTAYTLDPVSGRLSDDCRFRMLSVRSPALGRYLVACLPRVQEALGLRADLSHTDMVVNAYGGGGYLSIHTDAAKVPDPQHSVSAVYFLHRRPRGFEGGQLRLYDTIVRDGRPQCGETYQTIEPSHDTLVFFPSTAFHVVTATTCPSGEFADSRFTLNMWVLGGPGEGDETHPASSRTLQWMARAAAGTGDPSHHSKRPPIPLPRPDALDRTLSSAPARASA